MDQNKTERIVPPGTKAENVDSLGGVEIARGGETYKKGKKLQEEVRREAEKEEGG